MKIAISGLSGVGTSSSARLISERLQLPMYNFTFRDLAKEKGMPWEELQIRSKNDPSIDLELDRRLIEFVLNNESCLISTDLAGYLDDPRIYEKVGLTTGPKYDLKIWLEGSLKTRAQRMSMREDRSVEQLMIEEDKRDNDNRERYLKLYGVDLFDHTNVDWVLDTEDKTLDQVVDLIVQRANGLMKYVGKNILK